MFWDCGYVYFRVIAKIRTEVVLNVNVMFWGQRGLWLSTSNLVWLLWDDNWGLYALLALLIYGNIVDLSRLRRGDRTKMASAPQALTFIHAVKPYRRLQIPMPFSGNPHFLDAYTTQK